jgi:bifunctional non-homologous end joining protein LigD
MSDVLLPLLAERPVVCQRWPDGIDEFTWYQHRIPPRAPDYLRGVWIEGNHRILLSNKESLLWMVNQAALTLHGWSSRVKSLSEPDWVTLDLDPGDATRWEDVVEIAIAVRKLLELLELESVPKTSGQRGMHVLVPIARGHSVLQAQECALRIAQMIARLMPEKVTLDSAKEKRKGRLYLDHIQSFVGKSLALAYSLRAADGAPVSMPLAWSEVDARLDPKSFNLRTARARIDAKGDLTAPLLTGRAQLAPILERLALGR